MFGLDRVHGNQNPEGKMSHMRQNQTSKKKENVRIGCHLTNWDPASERFGISRTCFGVLKAEIFELFPLSATDQRQDT